METRDSHVTYENKYVSKHDDNKYASKGMAGTALGRKAPYVSNSIRKLS